MFRAIRPSAPTVCGTKVATLPDLIIDGGTSPRLYFASTSSNAKFQESLESR